MDKRWTSNAINFLVCLASEREAAIYCAFEFNETYLK